MKRAACTASGNARGLVPYPVPGPLAESSKNDDRMLRAGGTTNIEPGKTIGSVVIVDDA
jgi:hypothetical protein